MKTINLITIVLVVLSVTGCSGKAKVAMLSQEESALKMKYHYIIYTPMRYMAHDPITALKNKKYYVAHHIHTDFLGKVSGDKVFRSYDKFIFLDKKNSRPIFKRVKESYNKKASFIFTERYVKIKGIQICNEDNECISSGLEGKFKLVDKVPMMR